ncbi:MAG: hypothetical protein ACREEM_49135, partial [Blastocatellia bacterium]
MEKIAHTNAPAAHDGQRERIRPDPLPAPAPAQVPRPSESIEAPAPSGQIAPGIAASGQSANVITFPGSAKTSRRGRKAREVFGPDSIYVDP